MIDFNVYDWLDALGRLQNAIWEAALPGSTYRGPVLPADPMQQYVYLEGVRQRQRGVYR